MKTIVFIGSNKSGTSRDALLASSEMGYYTVLLTDREKFLMQADEFSEVDQLVYIDNLLDREKVMEEISRLKDEGKDISACLSFTDPFVPFAASLAEELGLVKLSTNALALMSEKTKFRETLKNLPSAPLYTVFPYAESIPKFVQIHKSYLPLILKSPVSNGSKDVILAETVREFEAGLRQLQRQYPKHPVLVEEYLMGTQYLIEVLVYNGASTIVAIIEQEIQNKERFIVTGYIFPAQLSMEEQEKLTSSVEGIIQTMGLSNGSCHLEMRKINGEWKLIEINPRMSGGAMNRIILEGTGIDYVKEIIKLNLGEPPCLSPTRNQHVYARFLTVNSKGRLLKVTGKNRASNYEGVREVFVKPRKGSILTNPHSMGDRYAYVIASSETPEQARTIAVAAAKEIKFYLDPL